WDGPRPLAFGQGREFPMYDHQWRSVSHIRSARRRSRSTPAGRSLVLASHTPHFLGADRVLLFDNGNRRCNATGATADSVCNSEGIRSRLQLYRLEFDWNGAPLRAVRERNVVLVRYSSAFGTAQLLPNGNLVGALGNIPTDSTATAPRVSYVEEIAVNPHTLLPVQSYTYIAREPPGDPLSVGGRTLRAQRAASLYSNPPAPEIAVEMRRRWRRQRATGLANVDRALMSCQGFIGADQFETSTKGVASQIHMVGGGR